MESSTKKVLIGLGIGCSVLIVIGIGIVVALGFFAKQAIDDMEANMSNPGPKAQETLGAQELPPGYEAHMAFSVPFLMEFVMLKELQPGETPRDPNAEADAAPPLNQPNPESGLVYFNMIRLNNADEAEGYIKGEAGSTDALKEAGINISVDQELGKGQFQIGNTTYFYTNHLGQFEMESPGGSPNSLKGVSGIASLIMADCPGDERLRIFYWYSKTEAIEVAAGEQIDLSNTGKPGDPVKMQELMSYFKLCGE